jgi:hypothetical protein
MILGRQQHNLLLLLHSGAAWVLVLKRKLNLAAKMSKKHKKKELYKFEYPKNPNPKGGPPS